jgi:hypothetical protein
VFTWWGSRAGGGEQEDGKYDMFVPLIHCIDVLWSVNTHYPHAYEVCLAVSSNDIKHRPFFLSTWTVFAYLCTSGCCPLRNTVLVKLCTSWDNGATAGNSIFGARFAKLPKVHYLLHVRPFRMKIWALTGQIFMKFGIWVFFENLSSKFKFR